MKRKLAMLMAVALLAVSAPVMAADGGTHKTHDAKCERECTLLLRDCSNEVDSLQDRIKKLQTAITEKSDTYTRDELTVLKKQLQDANETLRLLNKH